MREAAGSFGFGECTFCLCTKADPWYRNGFCSERTKKKPQGFLTVAYRLQRSDAVPDPSASLYILSRNSFVVKSSSQQKPVHLCISVFLQAYLEKSGLSYSLIIVQWLGECYFCPASSLVWASFLPGLGAWRPLLVIPNWLRAWKEQCCWSK